MKTSSLLISALCCACLFSTAVYAGDHGDKRHNADRQHREHRNDRAHRQNHRQHNEFRHRYRDDRRHRDHAHRDRHREHHRDRHREHHRHRDHRYHHKKHVYKHHRDRASDYFIGGLIVGSLGHYGRDHGRYHYVRDRYERGHRISFWRDRYGQCFRVEHRRHGKVYIEVPYYKCH